MFIEHILVKQIILNNKRLVFYHYPPERKGLYFTYGMCVSICNVIKYNQKDFQFSFSGDKNSVDYRDLFCSHLTFRNHNLSNSIDSFDEAFTRSYIESLSNRGIA